MQELWIAGLKLTIQQLVFPSQFRLYWRPNVTCVTVKLRLLMCGCMCVCGVPASMPCGRCAEKSCTVCTDAVLIYPVRLGCSLV